MPLRHLRTESLRQYWGRAWPCRCRVEQQEATMAKLGLRITVFNTEAVAGDVNAHEVLQSAARPSDEGGGTPGAVGRRVLSPGASEERELLVQRRESE